MKEELKKLEENEYEDFGDELLNSGFTPFNISELDKETILNEDIFNYVLSIDDNIQKTRILVELQDKAKELKVARSFDKLFKAYQTSYVQKIKGQGSNTIQFTNPPIKDLKCGKWNCKDTGVTKTILVNFESQLIVACPHPIIPIERLINIDTETEKIKLAFFKDSKWKNITVDRRIIANKSNIIMLADNGIEVNSDNAKDLVSFIADVINLNIDKIPVSRSTSHLGWSETEFAPYVEDLKYDGGNSFKDVYEAVKTKGDYDSWKEECKKLRKKSKVLHICLATSFASVLNSLLGINPYIVHIWGGTGTGKTVALMVAMSVWGNPTIGKLTRTLNATYVALARYCSFVKDIPFAGDELQIIKNRWSNFDELIMFLTEGADRSRGTEYGNLEQLKGWNCNFIFTGEEPITKANSGGGTKNRVIEIEAVETIIEDGNFVSNFVRKNYGYAGKEFIKNLPDKEKLETRYREIFNELLSNNNTTGKQSMAMASILLADELSTDLIFEDDKLKVEDIKEYLFTESEVDTAERAYDYLCECISQNINKFDGTSSYECWGKLDEESNCCYINKKVLDNLLEEAGYSFNAIKRKWHDKGLTEKDSKGKYTQNVKIGKTQCRSVKIILKAEKNEDIKFTDLPF